MPEPFNKAYRPAKSSHQLALVGCLIAFVTSYGFSLATHASPQGDHQAVPLGQFDLAAEKALANWHIKLGEPPGAHIDLQITTAKVEQISHQVLRLAYRMPATHDSKYAPEALLRLNAIDARAYDHLTLLIKAVPSVGPSPRLQVGFRRPRPRTEGLDEVAQYRMNNVTSAWQQIVIPLNRMLGISDWSKPDAFSIVLEQSDSSPAQGAFLIADIALINTGNPGPSPLDPVNTPEKDTWEKAHGGPLLARQALRERLVDWPQKLHADPQKTPGNTREFLLKLALDTWHGIEAFTDREHGLPMDRVQFGNASVAVDHALIGDYTSTTNIGMHLIAIVAARELQFITREGALKRLRDTLTSLERMESYRGFFFNYYNTTTLERTSNFVSFVDSSWLTAGLMVVSLAAPEIADRCQRLMALGDYRFFYDSDRNLMSHGYYVNLSQPAPYHYGSLYSEARLGSLIAIGRGEAPPQHWFAMHRTFPNSDTWQSRQPLAIHEKAERGFHWTSGYYQWQDLRYVPSWGGSLFEALMPTLLLDESRYAPASLGKNDQIHTQIHRRYAMDELGYRVWGMSPSSAPDSGRYQEFGVHFLGSLGYREGAVTPHAAALALSTEPDQAAANLRVLADELPVYGEYGMYDAVDPRSGNVTHTYLHLNQAMMLVALANHLADHVIQNYFAAHPVMQNALPLIGFETFFED